MRSHRVGGVVRIAGERDKETLVFFFQARCFPSSMRGFSWRIYARAVEDDARVRCARARSNHVEMDILRVKSGFASMERRVECVFGAGFRNRLLFRGP